jgi:methanogenic corrinoid protein MtbC1
LNSSVLAEINRCIVEIDIGRVRSLVGEALKAGLPPYQIFMEGIANGMDVVGQKYEANEYFLTELLGAAQVVDEAMVELSPHLQGPSAKRIGTVVLGTVKGDTHDIGKNILRMLLQQGLMLSTLRPMSLQRGSLRRLSRQAQISLLCVRFLQPRWAR